MNKTIDFIQKEAFDIYEKKYSKKYIKEYLLPVINYINTSKNNKFLVSGSQGIGKSSFTKLISKTLDKFFGKSTLLLSLDDYYLSKKDRLILSKKEHNLLNIRGVPGTHNIDKLINDIKKFDKSIYPIKIPIFDKLIDDIIKKKNIAKYKSDLLILEGWCCGCNPLKKKYLYNNINQLEKKFDSNFIWRNYYNNKLLNEYKTLFNLFDNKIFIKAPSFNVVLNWRLKQEVNNFSNLRGSKRMNVEEIKLFIQYYEKITKWMIKDCKNNSDLVISVDKDQKIIRLKKN